MRIRMKLLLFVLFLITLLVTTAVGMTGCGGKKGEGTGKAESSPQAFVDDMLQALSGRYGELQPVASSAPTGHFSLAASILPVETDTERGEKEDENMIQGEKEDKDVLQAKEIMLKSWDNVKRYIDSGYKDLDAAAKAQRYYQQLIQGEQEVLSEVEDVRAPDADAERINDQLIQGLNELLEVDRAVNDALLKAPTQDQAERASSAEELKSSLLPKYESAVSGLLSFCDNLLQYIRSNSLSGESDLIMWQKLLEVEKNEVKSI